MNENKELIETLKRTLKTLEQKEKKKSLKQRVEELEEEVKMLKENETQEEEYVIIDRFARRRYFKKDTPKFAKCKEDIITFQKPSNHSRY